MLLKRKRKNKTMFRVGLKLSLTELLKRLKSTNFSLEMQRFRRLAKMRVSERT